MGLGTVRGRWLHGRCCSSSERRNWTPQFLSEVDSAEHAVGRAALPCPALPCQLQCGAGAQVAWACDIRGAWAAVREYPLPTAASLVFSVDSLTFDLALADLKKTPL